MKKLILAAILAAVMLTGCDSGRAPDSEFDIKIYPNMTQYAVNDAGGLTFYYLVDNRTGVVYIAFDGLRRAGITVALNADGTPVTKEQLEVWREDNERNNIRA